MRTAQRLLAGATLYALSIPFHERFRHSEADRAACDSVVVLNFGEIIARGTPSEVARNPVVVEAYLGSDAGALA